MSNINAKDESSNHRYYTEVPNIIFEIGLKANQIALYLAIKRSAGDQGYCTKSSATLCKEAGIGVRNFPKIKKSLSDINKILGIPLIVVTPRFTECGDCDTDYIIVSDIWNENMQFFLDKRGGAKLQVPGAKLQGGVGAILRGGGAKLQDKQQPIKNNPIKKQQQVAVFFDCLVKDLRLDDDNRLSLMKFPEDRIKLALEYSHQVAPKKTLIHQLVWHCTLINPPKTPKKNFWDQVKKDFKNEEKYNHALCYINSEGIAFERGITNLSAKFSDPSGREKFEAALKQFGIKWKYE